MLISLISPKGGTGCSTASSLFALSSAKMQQTLLIDACCGDLHGIINPAAPPKYSFSQWCISPTPDTFSLEKIAHRVNEHLYFVSSEHDQKLEKDNAALNVIQNTSTISYDKRHAIVDAMSRYNGNCVIDLGQRKDLLAQTILDASDVIVMTLRQCFLSLTAASRHAFIDKVDALLVLKESGRSISTDQIAQTISNDVVIEIQARRDWAKTIDAGVLTHRTPPSMIEPVDAFLKDQHHNNSSQDQNDVFSDFEMNDENIFWARDDQFKEKQNPFTNAKKFFESVKSL